MIQTLKNKFFWILFSLIFMGFIVYLFYFIRSIKVPGPSFYKVRESILKNEIEQSKAIQNFLKKQRVTLEKLNVKYKYFYLFNKDTYEIYLHLSKPIKNTQTVCNEIKKIFKTHQVYGYLDYIVIKYYPQKSDKAFLTQKIEVHYKK